MYEITSVFKGTIKFILKRQNGLLVDVLRLAMKWFCCMLELLLKEWASELRYQ